MISKYRYEQNMLKYKEVLQYVKSHPNIAEDINKEMLYIIEKNRFVIGCMDIQEVKELIEKCIEENNNEPLKNQLHYIIGGTTSYYRDEDCCLYNSDERIDNEEYYI